MATDGPTTTLTVPAKPAAITVANLATLAGTAAAVAGPVGWAVAGAVASVPAAVAAKKAVTRRKNNRSRNAAGHSRPSPYPRVPAGSRAARPTPAGRAATAGRAAAGKPALGRSAGAGGIGGALRRAARTAASAAPTRGGAHRRGSSTATPGTRRGTAAAGKQTGAARTAARTAARRLASAAAAPARTLARFGRGLATQPKKKATAGSAYKNNRKRGLATASGAATRAAARNGWRLLGRWFRRFILRKKPKKKTKKTAKPAATSKKVAPIVDRGTTAGNTSSTPNPHTPTAAPGDPIRPGAPEPAKENTMTTADSPSGTREMAARMWANADSWNPRGMLTVVEEYHDLPQTLDMMRATVGSVMDKSMKRFPVDPAISQQISKIVEILDTAAAMARKIPEAVETIHEPELNRLRNPRVGEGMWDLSANGRG